MKIVFVKQICYGGTTYLPDGKEHEFDEANAANLVAGKFAEPVGGAAAAVPAAPQATGAAVQAQGIDDDAPPADDARSAPTGLAEEDDPNAAARVEPVGGGKKKRQ